MLPFPHWVSSREKGGIDQSRIRPEGKWRQAEGTAGRIKSKCRTEKRGWMDEEVEKNERRIRREGRGFKPGKVVPLEMGLPLGLAILSKSLQL